MYTECIENVYRVHSEENVNIKCNACTSMQFSSPHLYTDALFYSSLFYSIHFSYAVTTTTTHFTKREKQKKIYNKKKTT